MKYSAHKEIQSLLNENTQEGTDEAITKSIMYQVLCKKTAYICRIKENNDKAID